MQNQQISSDLIRGHIDTIILHTLLDSDKFAEQISDAIDKKSDGAYKINQATLYSALKRLESLKYVNSYQQDAVNGRRKFFTLTQSGKNFAEANLSSWSFSRSIIDKLIDCEPQPIIKTEYVEKIVQIPVERTVIKEIEVEKPVFIKETNEIQTNQPVQPLDNLLKIDSEDKKSNTETTQETAKDKDVQEVNFRNILNGLIQSTAVQTEEKQKEAVQLSPIEKDDVVKKEPEAVKDFNQTISEKSTNVTNIELTDIDFSDLVLKAQKEGFKINVSSKNANKPNGNLLKNKLNLFVSMAMFLVLSLELLFYVKTYKTILNAPAGLVLGLAIAFILWPIINLIIYKKSPQKSSAKNIFSDSILTSVILVFNLLLINFAGAMLFNLDFSITKDVLLYLAIPATIYIDLIIYSVIRFCFAKSKMCKIKTK